MVFLYTKNAAGSVDLFADRQDLLILNDFGTQPFKNQNRVVVVNIIEYQQRCSSLLQKA